MVANNADQRTKLLMFFANKRAVAPGINSNARAAPEKTSAVEKSGTAQW